MDELTPRELPRQYRVRLHPQEEIQAHEILLDAKARDEALGGELEESRLEYALPGKAMKQILIAIFLLFGVLLLRVLYLQFALGERFFLRSEANRTRLHLIPAVRGNILDRFGASLVSNIAAFELFVLPQDFSGEEARPESVFPQLAEILGVPQGSLEAKLREASPAASEILLADGISREAAIRLEALLASRRGFLLVERPKRRYLLGEAFGHLLGFTGKVSREDLLGDPKRKPTEEIGKAGLEALYESSLRGEDGYEAYERDATGRVLRQLSRVSPAAGENLFTGIDQELQLRLFQSLSRWARPFGGKAAGIALDPRGGQVRALVSLPSFDPNVFPFGTPEERSKLLTDEREPLFNRAVRGVYPSGSTIKPLIAAAALQEGVIDPFRTIYDPGFITVPHEYDPNIVYTFHDWKPLGMVDMIRGIALSANVYFYTVGGGYGDIQGLGIDRIVRYLKRFGWGGTLGIDLPNEGSGFLPTPEWKERAKGERWYIGDTYNASIGQGDIGVTPLQLAVSTAAIANNGTLWKPHIASTTPQALATNLIEPQYLELVRRGMREAVTVGSSRALADLPVKAAGKTGTAQFGPTGKQTHAWFAGFAPYENPELVIVILVEGGGEGSSTAVPVAKEVLSWYFTQRAAAKGG